MSTTTPTPPAPAPAPEQAPEHCHDDCHDVDPLTIPSDADAGRVVSKGVLAIDMDDVLW